MDDRNTTAQTECATDSTIDAQQKTVPAPDESDSVDQKALSLIAEALAKNGLSGLAPIIGNASSAEQASVEIIRQCTEDNRKYQRSTDQWVIELAVTKQRSWEIRSKVLGDPCLNVATCRTGDTASYSAQGISDRLGNRHPGTSIKMGAPLSSRDGSYASNEEKKTGSGLSADSLEQSYQRLRRLGYLPYA